MELLSYYEIKDKFKKIVEVSEILKISDNIHVKNYLLIKRFLNENGIDILREYNPFTDNLRVIISYNTNRIQYGGYINNFTFLEHGEMDVIFYIHNCLRHLANNGEKHSLIKKVFDKLDIMLSTDPYVTSMNVTFTILDEIFGDDIMFSPYSSENHYIKFSENYANLTYGMVKHLYKFDFHAYYPILNHICNMIIENRDLILSNLVFIHRFPEYFKNNGYTIITKNENLVSLHDKDDRIVAHICLDVDEDDDIKSLISIQIQVLMEPEFFDVLQYYARSIQSDRIWIENQIMIGFFKKG